MISSHKKVEEIDLNILFPSFSTESEEKENREEIYEGSAELLPGMDEIDEIESQAESIYEEARERGYKEGFEEGYNEGFQNAAKQVAAEAEAAKFQMLKEIESTLKDLEHKKEQFQEQHMEDLKNIAIAIGEKIIQTSLQASDDVIRRLILTAIARMKKTAWAKIYVGGGGQELSIEGDEKFLKELATLSDNVKVIIIDEEELGSCFIETPEEIVDAGVQTQMGNIKDIVENARV
ncbi:flagellar assembly protein FliH [Aequitasia blattaphilus]|uniref:FliH/SctL family protein n=1 Tax=Aequitasia blattaphilus TaxID=2949332 RepID=A0ABT1E9K3_9FIRM|nr:FliH/SctL family protein [Aequitasia blattaphilus]MCP1102505.1 FliH/SctL family protein [Aequitasia blattaphilus]MCR8615145.1 FliH/SctL family protein [Aequitasia blattaphilus]